MTPITLGLDIGGSKTAAILVCGESTLASVIVGGANVSAHGAAAAMESLGHLRAQLPADAQPVRIVAGAAGSTAAREELGTILATIFPQASIQVVHDSRIILAAAGLDTGIVTILGTGSATWGQDCHGKQAEAGGWGYLLGDVASGYGMVRSGLQRALSDHDAQRSPTSLTTSLLTACGLSDVPALLSAWYLEHDVRKWAGLSAVISDAAAAGSADARSIVDETATAAASSTASVAAQLGMDGPVVLTGGVVTHQTPVRDALLARLTREGLRDVRLLDVAPVCGAVRLAARPVSRPDEPSSTTPRKAQR